MLVKFIVASMSEVHPSYSAYTTTFISMSGWVQMHLLFFQREAAGGIHPSAGGRLWMASTETSFLNGS